jgi:hypothetical protein
METQVLHDAGNEDLCHLNRQVDTLSEPVNPFLKQQAEVRMILIFEKIVWATLACRVT